MRRSLCMIAAAAVFAALSETVPVAHVGPVPEPVLIPTEFEPAEAGPAPLIIPNSRREAAMARARKIREMRDALHLDEAAWEARRYEARKARCNDIADTVRKSLTYPTNAVSFSVDFRTGDIRVEFADGGAYVQRYVPGKEPVVHHLGKPRKNKNPKVILKPDGSLWNPLFRRRPKAK